MSSSSAEQTRQAKATVAFTSKSNYGEAMNQEAFEHSPSSDASVIISPLGMEGM